VCFDDRSNRGIATICCDSTITHTTLTANISANRYRIHASKQQVEADPANVTCTTGKQVILYHYNPASHCSMEK
jgi:hypothetical protein